MQKRTLLTLGLVADAPLSDDGGAAGPRACRIGTVRTTGPPAAVHYLRIGPARRLQRRQAFPWQSAK